LGRRGRGTSEALAPYFTKRERLACAAEVFMAVRLPIPGLLSAILGLLGACIVYALDKADGAKPATADGPTVRIERRDGSTFEGKLLQAVRLATDFGAEEIEAKAIRRIALRPPADERANDLVELNDKSQHRGRIQGAVLLVAIDDQAQNISLQDLREIKAFHKESGGIFAILFGLLTLTAMEIVLGIDNVIFLAIIAGKLPEQQQPRARRLGLAAALGTRILLLLTLSFLLGLTRPLFTLPDLPLLHDLEAREVSLRDLILLAGGLFLIGKSVLEMHEKLETAKPAPTAPAVSSAGFAKVLVQIAIIDIVFSLDSVITAVGMVEEVWVMITAMTLAMLVMLIFAGVIADFVARHPTLKVLALSFLILIGVMLTAEGLGQHMDKGYIYFAMAFAVAVEMFNLKLARKALRAVSG